MKAFTIVSSLAAITGVDGSRPCTDAVTKNPEVLAMGLTRVIDTLNPEFDIPALGAGCSDCLFLVREAATKTEVCKTNSSKCRALLAADAQLKTKLEQCFGFSGVLDFTTPAPVEGKYSEDAYKSAAAAKKSYLDGLVLSSRARLLLLDAIRLQKSVNVDTLRDGHVKSHREATALEEAVRKLDARYRELTKDEAEQEDEAGDAAGDMDKSFEDMMKRLEEESRQKEGDVLAEEEKRMAEAQKDAEARVQQIAEQQKKVKEEKERLNAQLREVIAEKNRMSAELEKQRAALEALKEKQAKQEAWLSDNDVPWFVKFGLAYICMLLVTMISFSLWFAISYRIKLYKHGKPQLVAANMEAPLMRQARYEAPKEDEKKAKKEFNAPLVAKSKHADEDF